MTQTFSTMKLLLSAGVIVFMAAITIAGTGAFFSDTETSEGNVFTAGALDLKVDSVAHYNGLVCFDSGSDFSNGLAWHPAETLEWNEDDEVYEIVPGTNLGAAIDVYNDANPAANPGAGEECFSTWELTDLGPETFFNFIDLKPGDQGENTISLHVENNDAYACVVIDDMVDGENGLTEPEADVDDSEDVGELSQELRFFAWSDDGDNIWESGEPVLFENTEGPAGDVIDGVVYPLFTPDTLGVLPALDTQYVGLYWCYGDITVNVGDNTLECDGSSVTNHTQTDSLTSSFTFYIEQARNNEDFTCPALGEVEPDSDRPSVGAAVAGDSFSYAAPTCDFTVGSTGDYATIAAAIVDTSNVPDESTVCVDEGTYNEFTVDRPLTIVGLNDPSGPNAAVVEPSAPSVQQLAFVQSSNVDIIGLVFDGDGTEFTGNQAAGVQISDVNGTNVSDVLIENNIIQNLVAGSESNSNKGIQIFADENGNGDVLNTTLRGNYIANVTATNRGAYGIQIVNDVAGIVVTENTIENIDGAWEAGLAVDGNNPANTSGVDITRNQITNGIPTFSIQIEVNVQSSEVAINENNLETLLYGGSSGNPSPAILDAENNWWGTPTPGAGAVGPDIVLAPITNTVDFTPAAGIPYPSN